MTYHDQLRHVCRWNRQLSREKTRLERRLRDALRQNEELEAANAALRTEAESTDALLGEAMKQATEAGRS